jgi:hypothetical protein
MNPICTRMDVGGETRGKGQGFPDTTVLQKGADHRIRLSQGDEGPLTGIGNGDAQRLEGSQNLGWTIEVDGCISNGNEDGVL